MTRRDGRRRAVGALLSPLVGCALITLLAACSGSTPTPQTTDGTTEQPTVAAEDAPPAEETARRFLDDFHDGHYDDIWAMLTPEAQQRWPGAEAFSGFLSRKFGSEDATYQIDRLEAGGDGASASVIASISVGDSGPTYKGPPLLLVRTSESWAVADAGPLGPEGPIIRVAAPLRPELTVPIMIYHHFAVELPADFEQRTLTVTSAAFEGELMWLSENGYRSIAVAEMYNAFYYDLPLPPKPIILVFDDGYDDAYLQAFPLLRKYGFGATVAAITGAVGQHPYLSWDQVKEMLRGGVEFVSHTVSHPDLGSLSADAERSELADSKRTLEEQLGRPAQFLVYPYGQPFASGSEAAREMILKLLPEIGYLGALTTSSGPPYISAQDANLPYQLHRIPVSGGESLARFAASIGATP